jgi:uncharacterized protein
MKLNLSLDYALAEGWLAPFVAGLRDGRAVAARCTACDAVSFPPARVCACGSRQSVWVTLDGTARVIWRTAGLDGDFALVQFAGASSSSIARLQGMPESKTNGQIAPARPERPAVVVTSDGAEPAP